MKNLPEKFQEVQTKNPYWSSYIQFVVSVGNGKYSKTIIRKWFNKLVEKDDYDKENKKRLVNQLIKRAKVIRKKTTSKKA